MTEAPHRCAKCNKTADEAGSATLNRCARCKQTAYCCRDCQKADWKIHKRICAQQANQHANSADAYVEANTMHTNNYSAPRLKDLEQHVPNPFTRLDQGEYLHDRPKKDVYRLLIDSFRMRQQDDMKLENKTHPNTIYTGAASSIEPFRKCLAQAGTRPGLLPDWWTPETRSECVAFGESGAWQDLRKKVTKEEMIKHYGDDKAPMQVRMLAEAIIGVGSMGQNGAVMRGYLSKMESGGLGDGHMSMMNMSGLFGGAR